MASVVEICNRALQKVGAPAITSLSDNSKSARECNVAYEPVRDALLREFPWKFAIKRVSLAADATDPDFGRATAFSLPADYIALLPPYEDTNFEALDWIVEGGKLLTNDSAPLPVRYVSKITDPNLMDPLFREALSAYIADEICEALTQSNSKKLTCENVKKETIKKARQAGSFESTVSLPPEDTFLTSRS